MGKLKIEWTAHADFERMLAEVFQDDPIEGIKELVANGFDADASRFSLEYHASSGILVAKDDGTGMGVYELKNGFYKSGNSLTRKAGKTKLGRNPMGNYGIGTIVMQYLARSYRLETWRDGQKITVEEEFEDGKRPKKTLKAVPETCDQNLHGTTITINPIRFPSDEVTLEQLTRRLALGVNVKSRLEAGDDFDIYVNDEKVELKNPRPAIVFAVSRHDDLIGQVHGIVNFYDSTPPYRGVTVRVNGRQVGSEDYFEGSMPSNMRGRVYADFDVDLMSSRISFSRARFQEDSPHFRRLVGILEESFRSHRGEIDGYIRNKVLAKGKLAIESALSGAVEQLGSVSVSNQKKQRAGRNSRRITGKRGTSPIKTPSDIGEVLLSTDSAEGYKVVLAADQSANYGAIDHKAGILSINVNHPFFVVPNAHPEGSLQLKIVYALSNILGQDKFESKPINKYDRESLHARNEAISRLTQKVFSGHPKLLDALISRSARYSKRGISPNRMYSSSELSRESSIDIVWLNKFQEAGILMPTVSTENEERYYGANVILALERLKGGTPAFQLVREYVSTERTEVTRQGQDQLVHKVDKSIEGLKTPLLYVFNVSATNAPLYVVMPGYNGRFIELYKAGHIRRGHVVPEEFTSLLEKLALSPPPKNPAVGMEGTESYEFMKLANISSIAPGLVDADVNRATVYTAMARYDKGDIILHEGFGYGYVLETKDRSFDIRFKSGKATLAHNR